MRDAFEEKGFVFAPNFFSTAETDVLLGALDACLADVGDPTRFILEKDGKTVRTVVNAHLWNDRFRTLTRHPALLTAVEEILGEPAYAWQMGINAKAALKGDVWFWHQDYPAYRADDFIAEPRMVNALIFLDPVTDLNGPLMLAPGSHRMEEGLPERSDGGTSYSFRYSGADFIARTVAETGIDIPKGEAGSVIFMHVNALHASGANLSPWPRRMITLTYNAISNKATRRSIRPAHIVPDDKDTPALTALGPDCLSEPTR